MPFVDSIFAFGALVFAVAALTFAFIGAYALAERWSVTHRARLVLREANREILRHERLVAREVHRLDQAGLDAPPR